MPKIDTVKRITTDEFPEESREVAERIGNIYNYFAEQVTNVINGNIDSENTGRPVIPCHFRECGPTREKISFL